MSPLVDRNRGIRLPPRLAPQDQYAEGILSLSEKQPGGCSGFVAKFQ
jgi:hypothetical protein